MSPSCSVVVVGGGVFGAVTAFELARSGRQVVLFDRDPVGVHASGRNPANLNPILGTPAALLPLALESFHLHDSLHEDLAAMGCGDYSLEPVRRVLAWCDDAERESLRPVAQAFAEQPGFASRWLDAAEVKRLEPRLAAEAAGALLLEGNRSLDAPAFSNAVLTAAARCGARVVRADVRHVAPLPGGFLVEADPDHTWECGSVVFATGPWVEETKNWLDTDVPVRPVRGQMARVRLPGGSPAVDVTHGTISIYRRGSSAAWVGATREEAGFDERPTADGLHSLIDAAARLLPCVRDADVAEHVAALRPMTPDGLPLVGSVPGREGTYLANGGGGKGMLLCAAAGRAIRDLIVDGGTALPVAAVAPGRHS